MMNALCLRRYLLGFVRLSADAAQQAVGQVVVVVVCPPVRQRLSET